MGWPKPAHLKKETSLRGGSNQHRKQSIVTYQKCLFFVLRLKIARSTARSLEELIAAETSKDSEGHWNVFLLQLL